MPADTLLNNRYRVKRPLAEDGMGAIHLTAVSAGNPVAAPKQLFTSLHHLMLPPVFDDDPESAEPD